MAKHTVLFGGGLDSSAVLSRLVGVQTKEGGDGLDSILVIHVNYGQKAVEAERLAAKKQMQFYGLTSELVTLSMDMSYSGAAIMPNSSLGSNVAKNNLLELRNPTLMMLSASYLASVYPDTHHFIYVGLHREPRGTAFLDAVHYLYLNKLNSIINSLLGGSTNILIRAPYKNSSRATMLTKLIQARGESFVRDYVHTCYEHVPCGTCTHCVSLKSMLENTVKE